MKIPNSSHSGLEMIAVGNHLVNEFSTGKRKEKERRKKTTAVISEAALNPNKSKAPPKLIICRRFAVETNDSYVIVETRVENEKESKKERQQQQQQQQQPTPTAFLRAWPSNRDDRNGGSHPASRSSTPRSGG